MTSIANSDPVAPVAPGAPDPLVSLRCWPARIAIAAGLVGLGDWLFYGRSAGITIILFVLAIGAVLPLTNEVRIPSPRLAAAFGLLVLACLPGIEHLGLLPLGFAFGGLAFAALLATGQGGAGLLAKPLDALRLLLSGPWRLVRDVRSLIGFSAGSGFGRALLAPRRLAGWIVPLGLLGAFAILFADANPLIESWLRAADPAWALAGLSPQRVIAWGLLLVAVWPFLEVRLPAALSWKPPVQPLPQPGEALDLADILLGREAIARSLVLFNLLFAVQTASDAAFLWAGIALPEGMTYASYAHRGAYPLILTALLAAGFVLAAMRPGGPAENAPRLLALVYLFVAQNVGLVLSSILRLDLYVSAYSLTYWRVAAFVWMGLVLIGLVLIAIRIAGRRSNRWLIGANLVAATAVLYLCCFVNVPGLIAQHNVAHQPPRRLDLHHLVALGPQAIPAIDRVLPTLSDTVPMMESYPAAGSRQGWLRFTRQRLARSHRMAMADWRSWSFRGWRLSRYLDVNPERPAAFHEAPPAPVAPVAPAAPVESGEPAR